jgi:hypothetical protein
MLKKGDYMALTRVINNIVCAALLGTISLALHSQEVSIDAQSVHVPKGFDSNDNAEVIITGELPSTCYLRPQGKATLVGEKIQIDLVAQKVSSDDMICITAVVPYVISVPLGNLDDGNYPISVNEGGPNPISTNIAVDRANTRSVDNYNYANVTAVVENENQSVAIRGIHPSSCMEIERVEIVPNDKNDTLAVLPILKQTQDICDRRIKPFSFDLDLANFKTGTLLHIRKLDGQAMNYLIGWGK